MEGSPRGATLTGLMLLVAGLVVFFCATNVIPTDDKSFGAPRWMVAAIGLLFPGAGVYVFLMPYTTEAQTSGSPSGRERRRSCAASASPAASSEPSRS